MWPWSKIQKLEKDIEVLCQTQNNLVDYIDRLTGIRHVVMGRTLYKISHGGLFEVKFKHKFRIRSEHGGEETENSSIG